VVRYDARGHGLSYASVDAIDYSWPSLAKDMLGIADELELDTVALGGISMGCATALFAALAAPHRVSRLILTTPPTAWETRPPQAALYEQLGGSPPVDVSLEPADHGSSDGSERDERDARGGRQVR